MFVFELYITYRVYIYTGRGEGGGIYIEPPAPYRYV